MRKLRLKRWVLVVTYFILVIIFIYVIVSLFTKKITVITEGKHYTCYGSKILQVCSGYDYDIK